MNNDSHQIVPKNECANQSESRIGILRYIRLTRTSPHIN